MTKRPIKRFGRQVQLVMEVADTTNPLPPNEDPPMTTTTETVVATVQPLPPDVLELMQAGARWDEYREFYVDRAGVPEGLKRIRVDSDEYNVTQVADWHTYFRVVGQRSDPL